LWRRSQPTRKTMLPQKHLRKQAPHPAGKLTHNRRLRKDKSDENMTSGMTTYRRTGASNLTAVSYMTPRTSRMAQECLWVSCAAVTRFSFWGRARRRPGATFPVMPCPPGVVGCGERWTSRAPILPNRLCVNEPGDTLAGSSIVGAGGALLELAIEDPIVLHPKSIRHSDVLTTMR